jgi:hypothetical protein
MRAADEAVAAGERSPNVSLVTPDRREAAAAGDVRLSLLEQVRWCCRAGA